MFTRSLLAGLAVAGLILTPGLEAPAAGPPCDVLFSKVYPVADLIVPVRGTFAFPGGTEAPVQTQEARLIHVIQSTLAPQSWNARGGEGCIDYFPIGMSLVVRQTAEIHAQLGDLLSALRRVQAVEVAVELRFLTVSDACLSKLGVAEEGESETRVLDETQVQQLLEIVQADPRTNILQAPKVTVFNGQNAVLDLSEQQCFVTGVEFVRAGDRKIAHPQTRNVKTGLQVSMLPVVGPDSRTMTLQLGVTLGRTALPKVAAVPMPQLIRNGSGEAMLLTGQVPPLPSSAQTFETTVKLSDGATALLTGWTHHSEVRNLVAAPVLSKIPYLNQLFRNFSYGKENEHLLVLVTPRVLVIPAERDVRVPALNFCKTAAHAEAVPPPAPDADAATTAAWAPPKAIPASAIEPAPQPAPVEYVQRRCFRLDYALNDVGPTGVSKVAVWYRRDVTPWAPYDQEVPAKGHVTITVPEDGRWGFTLVPCSGVGRSPAPPKADEQPQVWVEVDTQAPTVCIARATAGVVHGEELLQVEYRSEDAYLKNNPVTISYAPSPEGPWTVLTRGLSPTGQFSWPLKGLPAEFHVRVEAEDQAGNIGQAAERIQADLKIPRVREVKVKVEE